MTIEEAAELLPEQPNVVTLISNRDGVPVQSADILLTSTLRMRPDRIVLGEVRGREALTFLEAINNGSRRLDDHPACGNASARSAAACDRRSENRCAP